MELELTRVRSNIGDVVLKFAEEHYGREFHDADLVAYVSSRGVKASPSSPTRILRQLKKEGLISYTLVSRAKSLYKIDSVISADDPTTNIFPFVSGPGGNLTVNAPLDTGTQDDLLPTTFTDAARAMVSGGYAQ